MQKILLLQHFTVDRSTTGNPCSISWQFSMCVNIVICFRLLLLVFVLQQCFSSFTSVKLLPYISTQHKRNTCSHDLLNGMEQLEQRNGKSPFMCVYRYKVKSNKKSNLILQHFCCTMSISLDLHIVVGGSIVSPFFCWFLLCSVLWVSSCPVKVFFISRVRVQHIHAKMCLKLKTSKYLCDDRPLQFYHCYFGKLFVRLEFGFMHICTLLNARKSQQPTITPIQPTATPKKQKS